MASSSLRLHVASVAALLAVVTVTAQPSPALRIASPAADAYLSGPVRLVARVDPPSVERTVAQMVFFAGGKQVCAITRPPFECDWDSGDRVVEHQIRATALLKDGTRLVANVRTRGLTRRSH
jgi:hypothetical protein